MTTGFKYEDLKGREIQGKHGISEIFQYM